MLRILTRRDFLAVGVLGPLALAPVLAASGRARRCVLLFLTGGPPQHDTWDMKPDAPANIRGELKPIATSVPGIRICELFPRLARLAHRYSIVRSVTHGDTVHTSAGYTMLTGVVHPKANATNAALIVPSADDHPHFGSLLSKARGGRPGMPAFVALPEVIKDAAVNEFPGLNAGLMGKAHAPLLI